MIIKRECMFKQTILHTLCFILIIIGVSIFSASCQMGEKSFLEYTHRSGTIENDDIEEPLNEYSKSNEDLLNFSNNILGLLKNRNYSKIYSNYFSAELKGTVAFEDFKKLYAGVVKKIGKQVSYKKMQWYFVSTKKKGRPLLVSIKIVHHKKAIMYYSFSFTPDDREKMIGFHFRLKKVKNKKSKKGIKT